MAMLRVLGLLAAVLLAAYGADAPAQAQNWNVSQKNGNSWNNEADAAKIQNELKRVGCLIGSLKPGGKVDGEWHTNSVTAFNNFLRATSQTYTTGTAIENVLALFSGYGKGSGPGCKPVAGGGGQCNVPKLVKNWIRDKDTHIKTMVLKTDEERKNYVGFMTLWKAVRSTNGKMNEFMPSTSGLDAWLKPKSAQFATAQTALSRQLRSFNRFFPAIVTYYAIQDAVTKAAGKGVESACERCLLLLEYQKLLQRVSRVRPSDPLFGQLYEKLNGTEDQVPLKTMRFAALKDQRRSIQDWYTAYFDRTENGGDASIDKQALLAVIGHLKSFHNSDPTPDEKRTAAYWNSTFANSCKGLKPASGNSRVLRWK